MKKLCTATLLAAAGLASLGAIPADAAPRADGWSAAPHIDSVGGTDVEDHLTDIGDWASVITRDARPAFVVSVESSEQANGRLRIFDRTSGDTVCESDGTGSFTLGCTPDVDLGLGTNDLAAVVTSTDGSQSSPASLDLDVQRWFGDPTIRIDALDTSTGSATVSGTSTPGTNIRVWSGSRSATPTAAADGRWSASVDGLSPENGGEIVVRSHAGGVGFNASARLPWPTAVPDPVVVESVREQEGRTVVRVSAEVGTDILIRNEGERVVAGAHATTAQTDIVVSTPMRRVQWSAEQKRGAITSRKTLFEVNSGGSSSPLTAPAVAGVVGAAGRHVVTVAAEPGATLSIVDNSGKLVALRRAGTTGDAQLTVGAPAGAYVVTQTIDGLTSPPAGVVIPD